MKASTAEDSAPAPSQIGSEFLVVAPPFDDTSGGRIVLHYLCHLLNTLGYDARLFPIRSAPLRFSSDPVDYLKLGKHIASQLFPKRRYRINPIWRTPVSLEPPGKDSIVIYPEIVSGNPLRAERVVRWVLHKPGFISGRSDFSTDELLFHYQQAFVDPTLLADSHQLRLSWFRDDIYRPTGESPRAGSCYMLRKGQGRQIIHETEGALLVDGLAHAELAGVFNEREMFISYDPYTMYNRFAAMCGCLSVVVPIPGVTKLEWRPEEELRYGVAYGFDDLDWAIDSRPRLWEWIASEKERQSELVRWFASEVVSHFSR